MKEASKDEYILFSDMLARELQDPEFRRLYEAGAKKEEKIRAKIRARIAAKEAKEASILAKAKQPETAII